MSETAPPGWEATVERMKGDEEIVNPFALSAWMAEQGYQPAVGENRPQREVAPLVRRAKYDASRLGLAGVPGLRENSLANLGQLARVGVHGMPEMYRSDRECGGRPMREAEPLRVVTCDGPDCVTPLREAEGFGKRAGRIRVVLMTEGAGNRLAGNYYPAETLRRDYRIFEGQKCFLDHPGRDEENNRPERSVRDQCGWFSEAAAGTIDGKAAITAWLNFMRNAAGREARELIESALEYNRAYPSEVLVGFSIYAGGPTHDVMLDGSPFHYVDGITACTSADIVTFPARGGRVVGTMIESDRSGGGRSRWRDAFDSALWRCEVAGAAE